MPQPSNNETGNFTRRNFLKSAVFVGVSSILLTQKDCTEKLERVIEMEEKTDTYTQLNEFEEGLAVAAVAIDTLWGGDYRDKTGEAHLIVDAYCSGKEEPSVGPEDLKQLFLKEGCNVTDKDKIKTFIKKNKIEERLANIRDYANFSVEDKLRREFLHNIVKVLDVHLNLRLNMVGLGSKISDEYAYFTAFGRAPDFINPKEVRENLIHYLEAVGLPLTKSTTLTELVDKWSQRTLLNADQMYEQWAPMSKELYNLSVKNIFPLLPEWASEITLDSIDFDIIRQDVHYSGVNLAQHTIVNGKPVYHTIIRISNKAKRSKSDYKLGLVAHEGMPGHGLHIPLMHGLYARGERGFETTLMILCSPEGTLAEGLATSTTNLLYGTKLEDKLTKDELVSVALDDLNVIGRNNVVVKYINGEKDKNKLAQFLREEYCFTDVDSKKYTEKWLFNERMGKLLGIMYLPSYGVGREVVKKAIVDYGREAVIPVVYGTKGQIDIINFRERLDETISK